MSNRVFGGWKKAVVYDPATGDLVQFNTLSTDESSFAPEIIQNETPTGQAFGGRTKPLVIGFLESDGLAQLETWLGTTPLSAVVYVPGGQHILFRETEQFFYRLGPGIDARDGAAVHAIETEAHGEDPVVWQYKNLAEAIDFTGESGELIFPLQGPTLTLAADYASIDSPELSIEAQDYAGATLTTSSQAVASGGRESTTITLPADTYKLAIDLVGSGSADVTNVSLRSDDEAEYITY